MPSYVETMRQKIGHGLLMLPSVAALIRDEEGRLLVQRKAASEGWSLPAGAIEPGESPQAAVIREVAEETGLRVVKARLCATFGGAEFRHTYPNGDCVEYTVLMFECNVTDSGQEPSDEETVRLEWFTKATMPPLALPYPADVLFPGS